MFARHEDVDSVRADGAAALAAGLDAARAAAAPRELAERLDGTQAELISQLDANTCETTNNHHHTHNHSRNHTSADRHSFRASAHPPRAVPSGVVISPRV